MKTVKSTKGEAYPMICVYIIIFVSLLALIITYTSAISKVDIMRENTKVVLDSFVTENARDIYDSIKQGNDYTEEIESEVFNSALMSFCTLEEKNNMLYSMDGDGKEKFHITMPTIAFNNELELTVRYEMNIPMSFAGITYTNASIPIEVTSNLIEKF